MSPLLIGTVVAAYFSMLLVVAHFTSKGADTEAFFRANRQSPWYLVAFGMIGASLSGVTFVSVPGWVGTSSLSYFQMVLGYLVGYAVIALVLMPLYYRLDLTTIYSYLKQRLGPWSYRSGAFFFLVSRVVGSSFRLFLVANVFQITIFDPLGWGVPFWFTVTLSILLIWLYTFQGGIKTIVWTDTLQTFFMLVSVGVAVWGLAEQMGLGLAGLVETISQSQFSQVFFFEDAQSPSYFWKQFAGGAFIAVVMTGLDQDMMQKNLTCRNLGEAQKNMFWFSLVLVLVNLSFLTLGVLLYEYALSGGLLAFVENPEGGKVLSMLGPDGQWVARRTDDLFPLLATQGYLLPVVGLFFVLGLVAAAYSSADSALTALTTSFSVDFLDVGRYPEPQRRRVVRWVHAGVSLVLVLAILGFHALNDQSVASAIFTAAGYTYGPLLGLFAFGLASRRPLRDRWVPWVCLASPVLTYWIQANSEAWLGGYRFGFELVALNGAICFLGLWFLSLGMKRQNIKP